jgi:hypothetical protein
VFHKGFRLRNGKKSCASGFAASWVERRRSLKADAGKQVSFRRLKQLGYALVFLAGFVTTISHEVLASYVRSCNISSLAWRLSEPEEPHKLH